MHHWGSVSPKPGALRHKTMTSPELGSSSAAPEHIHCSTSCSRAPKSGAFPVPPAWKRFLSWTCHWQRPGKVPGLCSSSEPSAKPLLPTDTPHPRVSFHARVETPRADGWFFFSGVPAKCLKAAAEMLWFWEAAGSSGCGPTWQQQGLRVWCWLQSCFFL